MFDRLSNDDVIKALDELILYLGVKDDPPSHELFDLLRKGDAGGCVQLIARQLGLPIRVDLSVVQKDYRRGDPGGFRSNSLVNTTWSGRRADSIAAQVSIPSNIPMFGTSSLQGFPIQVRVSNGAKERPAAFVAVMAHELSHVLLASLRHPHKDSELHTDLVPIVLGFRGVVREGRRTVTRTGYGSVETTRTTTYGYLTDSQFDCACAYVEAVAHRHSRSKSRLRALVGVGRGKLETAARSVANCRDYLSRLGSRPPRRMKKEHAQRVVRLYGSDCARDWQQVIANVERKVDDADAFARHVSHYTPRVVDQLETHVRTLEVAREEIERVIEAIGADEQMLRRYVGTAYIIRRCIRSRLARW